MTVIVGGRKYISRALCVLRGTDVTIGNSHKKRNRGGPDRTGIDPIEKRGSCASQKISA